MQDIMDNSVNTAIDDLEDLSDPTVSRSDMYAYGYSWDGMIPLGRDKALELYDKGCLIFRLYENDAEGEVDSREEILEFDGLFGTEDFKWIEEHLPASETDLPIEVFIHNPFKYNNIDNSFSDMASDINVSEDEPSAASETPSGEWLTLPTDAETLRAVLERIGVDGNEVTFEITAIRVPEYLSGYISKHDSLDELNMLASYLDDEHLDSEKLSAILKSGITNVQNTADIINLLDADNFDAFDVIDAKDHESLGRYYDDEHDEKPEDMSYADYGKQCAKSEGGVFTNDYYVHHRHKEISKEYNGTVPDEYKILDSAVVELKSQTHDTHSESKQSVLKKLFASRKSSDKSALEDSETQKPKKEKL